MNDTSVETDFDYVDFSEVSTESKMERGEILCERCIESKEEQDLLGELVSGVTWVLDYITGSTEFHTYAKTRAT